MKRPNAQRLGAHAALSLLLLAGCSGDIPATHPHATGGKDFCSRLEGEARVLSSSRSAQAWLLGITAGTLLASGAVVATTDQPDSKEDTAGRNVHGAFSAGLPLAGALVGTGAFFAFTRASDASELAAAAARGVNESSDERAAAVCNEAIAAWNDGRAAALDAAAKKVTDPRKPSGAGDTPNAPPPSASVTAPAASASAPPSPASSASSPPLLPPGG